MRVLIAGGGVGGLTLALMLHHRGIACTVLEAAEEVRELGVGINNLPHCVAEWAELGLLEELRRHRHPDAGAALPQPSRPGAVDRAAWAACRARRPAFSIHRGRLHGMLWRAAERRLPPGSLRCGHRLLDFAQDAAGVTARFATPGGEEVVQGDVLVGADGIHSALRALLHPEDGGIRWQGILMWRGAVDWPAYETGDVMFIAGDLKAKLVCYPIGPGSTPDRRLTNWAVYAKVDTGSSHRRGGRTGPAPEGCATCCRWRSGSSCPSWTRRRWSAPPPAARIPDVRPRPAALVEHGAGHAARRRGASDVPGRLQRRVPGGARRALPGRCAGRPCADRGAAGL
ncbi:FAD-dependent monooxygenase [Dankookia sp. P2]|uniref:FAD-dependent monooxygenase n=1 Tax=Dankookia sp. P2 TaxID=3423955 RepID=UPI003D66A823